MPVKTELHFYNLDERDAREADSWRGLKKLLEATPGRGRVMHASGTYFLDIEQRRATKLDAGPVELSEEFLFNNQWNTVNGARVFDWAEEALFDAHGRELKYIHRGHYLDITPEMIALRADTLVCGYCGAYARDGVIYPPLEGLPGFCGSCIDNEYLTPNDAVLLRMIPVCDAGPGAVHVALSSAEREAFQRIWTHAQVHGVTERGKTRLAKQRDAINAKCTRTVAGAREERDGLLYLLDAGVRLDNVIFYPHTGRFNFGWRRPLTAEELAELEPVLRGFRWAHDIQKV